MARANLDFTSLWNSIRALSQNVGSLRSLDELLVWRGTPDCTLNPRHCERDIRNQLAQAHGDTCAAVGGSGCRIDCSDSGAPGARDEVGLQHLLQFRTRNARGHESLYHRPDAARSSARFRAGQNQSRHRPANLYHVLRAPDAAFAQNRLLYLDSDQWDRLPGIPGTAVSMDDRSGPG